MTVDAQTRPGRVAATKSAAKTTRQTTSVTAQPFKGHWKSSDIDMTLDLYAMTVDGDMGDKCYGYIEGVFQGGRRIDSNCITQVISIEGNVAKVKGQCSFNDDGFTATLTFNPANGSITMDTKAIGEGFCYMDGKCTLRKDRGRK